MELFKVAGMGRGAAPILTSLDYIIKRTVISSLLNLTRKDRISFCFSCLFDLFVSVRRHP